MIFKKLEPHAVDPALGLGLDSPFHPDNPDFAPTGSPDPVARPARGALAIPTEP